MSGQGTAVAVLHPGSMGAAVGGQLARRGLRVLWLPEGRSAATVRRAEAAGLEAAVSLPDLLARADVVISLCPPAAAEEVARRVAAGGGFVGSGKVFVEANAVTPERVRRIADLLPGVAVVDASVIGSPPAGGKQPRLYVSGPSGAVDLLAGLFSGRNQLLSLPAVAAVLGARRAHHAPPAATARTVQVFSGAGAAC